jgi:hypothetical protein
MTIGTNEMNTVAWRWKNRGTSIGTPPTPRRVSGSWSTVK